jgi:hypothetical protein
MNTIIHKTRNILLGLAVASVSLVPAASALAYQTQPVSFNDHPNDCPTVMVANNDTQAGHSSPCWATSIPTIQAGEVINVRIYYHNTGYQNAENVRVRLTQAQSMNGTSFKYTGQILYNGSVAAQGSVSVSTANITGMEFGSVYWLPNQSQSPSPLPGGQDEDDIFSSNGISIGTLIADNPNINGFKNQGSVIISFRAGSNGGSGNTSDTPSVTTNSASSVGNDEATLNGTVATNGQATNVWFKYRKTNTTLFTTTPQYQNGSGSFDQPLSNLSNGDYEFKACAAFQSNGIEECGNFKYFTIGNGNSGGNGDIDNPDVETQSANNIDDDRATLRGELTDDGGDDNLDVWFEWGTSSSNLNNDADAGSVDDDGDDFSKSITGLNDDTRYYFRACAENEEGIRCGNVLDFRTDNQDNQIITDGNDLPTVQTLSVIQTGSNFGTVDGFYNANGCSVDTWFEYGTSQSNLNRSTVRAGHGNGSGSMAQGITGLAANTTYFYRAVAENCEGRRNGQILSFRTQSGNGVTVPPAVINTNTNNTNTVFVGGGGSSFIRLMITNNQDTARPGEELTYDVTWENISGRTLSDLVLEVNLPKVLRIDNIEDGEIDRTANSVVIEISELQPREIGETSIDVISRANLTDGDPVVARAIMAFENPTTQATENAIAYDSDEFNRNSSGLGAFLFGVGFFPTTLVGWLLLLLVILGIYLLARRFMSDRGVGTVTNAATPVAPAAGTDGEYVAYRPMPKQ